MPRAVSRSRQSLRAVATRQDGVVRRDQLRSLGFDAHAVSSELRANRWQAIGPVIVVLHNGPLTHRQKWWAAVLNAGPRAALAGRTAAQAGGLTGWESEEIEVVVPKGSRAPDLPGLSVIVHESRRLQDADVHPTLTPRRTRLERSLIDAAAWSGTIRTACGLICAGVQQRLTTADRLASSLAEAGQIRYRRLLLATVRDVAGGAEALSEIDFSALCRRHKLPVTARQTVRRDRSGKRRYLDVTLTGPDGQIVHAEIDGALHLLVRSYWDDMDRGNERVIAGERLLRFPSIAVRIDEARVADQLGRALGLTASPRAA